MTSSASSIHKELISRSIDAVRCTVRSDTFRRLAILAVVVMIATGGMTGLAAADDDPSSVAPDGGESDLNEVFEQLWYIIAVLVIGVAAPNGAYGFFQYMTAGASVEQDEQGKTRIRRTFIALAGVVIIQAAVSLFVGGIGF